MLIFDNSGYKARKAIKIHRNLNIHRCVDGLITKGIMDCNILMQLYSDIKAKESFTSQLHQANENDEVLEFENELKLLKKSTSKIDTQNENARKEIVKTKAKTTGLTSK